MNATHFFRDLLFFKPYKSTKCFFLHSKFQGNIWQRKKMESKLKIFPITTQLFQMWDECRKKLIPLLIYSLCFSIVRYVPFYWMKLSKHKADRGFLYTKVHTRNLLTNLKLFSYLLAMKGKDLTFKVNRQWYL